MGEQARKKSLMGRWYVINGQKFERNGSNKTEKKKLRNVDASGGRNEDNAGEVKRKKIVLTIFVGSP
jgi:hypothetical protein